jgi:hypothetical protein
MNLSRSKLHFVDVREPISATEMRTPRRKLVAEATTQFFFDVVARVLVLAELFADHLDDTLDRSSSRTIYAVGVKVPFGIVDVYEADAEILHAFTLS